jgi:hypothetical protein
MIFVRKMKWEEKVLSHLEDFFEELTLAEPCGELDFKVDPKLQFVFKSRRIPLLSFPQQKSLKTTIEDMLKAKMTVLTITE